MVRFIDNIFCSDSIKAKADSIKWRAVCGVGLLNVSFITLSENGTDIFDIYPGLLFKQKAIRKSDMIIIGIASGREAATELVEQMINRALADTGDISEVRKYYEKYIACNI